MFSSARKYQYDWMWALCQTCVCWGRTWTSPKSLGPLTVSSKKKAIRMTLGFALDMPLRSWFWYNISLVYRDVLWKPSPLPLLNLLYDIQSLGENADICKQAVSCSGISSVDVDEVFIDFHGFSTSLTAPCISLDPYCQDVVQLATDTHRLCIGFLSSVILKIESWMDMSNIGHQTVVGSKIHGHVPYFCCSYWSATGFERLASAGHSPHSPWSPAPEVGEKLTSPNM